MTKIEQQTYLQNFELSFFDNCTTSKPSKTTSLYDFLKDTQKGTYEAQIKKLRACKSKDEKEKFKQSLPCVSLSGVFDAPRKKDTLKKYSGLIQIDFDKLPDPQATKSILEKDPYTLAAFISPSGDGVKLVVRSSEPQQLHDVVFLELEKYYSEKYGLFIDSKCKDIPRLFFFSYDKTLFLNTASQGVKAPSVVQQSTMTTVLKKHNPESSKDIAEQIKIIVERIEEKGADITQGYDNWRNVGFALCEALGENGREYFDRVSRINPEYTHEKTDAQYTKCLNAKGGTKVGVQTFFHLAKTSGVNIVIKNDIKAVKHSVNKRLQGFTTETQTNVVNDENATANSENNSEDESRLNPKFIHVEKYLKERFDFRYNESCNELQAKRKGEKLFTTANPDDIFYNMKRENVTMNRQDFDALLRSSFVPRFDEFENYFSTLPEWDGVTDHIEKLASHVKCNDQERFNWQFKKALVRTVKQAIGRNYYNKHCFVIAGEKQHTGKSYFINFLCPPILKNYITDTFSGNKANKDELLSLCENYIINLEELSILGKTEINQLKAFFTYQAVKQRKAYDKVAKSYPRRASFWASTNNKEFLEDATGNIRWVCFEIDSIDQEYSKTIDIDKVYAQAYLLLKSGFNCEITKDEIQENETANKEFRKYSMEEELILKYFQPDNDKRKANFYSATDIYQELIKRTENGTRINQNNVGKACKALNIPNGAERPPYSNTPRKGYYILPIFEKE